jgi:tetratricopeptide (TPR) repeat protein
MVWNALFGGGCLWLAFVMNSDNRGQTLQDQCYNGNGTYSVREVISACDRLLAESSTQLRERPDDPNAYFNRGFVYEHRGDLPHAIADFSEVVRLRPDDPAAYYYRWAAYRDLGDEEHAKADLATLTRLSPKVAATVQGNRAD